MHIESSRLAHKADNTDSIRKLCVWINGGGNHDDHRRIHRYFIDRELNDVPPGTASQFPIIDNKTPIRMKFVRATRIVNGRPVRVIVGTRQSTTQLTADHTFQQ